MAKKTSKKSSKKSDPTTSSNGTPATLDSASVAELERALAARKRGAATLLKKRERIAAQLADIDNELSDLGIRPDGSSVAAAGGGEGGRRPRNAQTLPEAMAAVMKGSEMGIREIADAVLASGYQSSSANFTTIISQALGRDKRFKKVSRGVYTAK